jgi:glycosyltransferase involved in cell wall biosynthesis
VIGSRIGGLEQRIHHGEDGLLVQPGDAVALARAMERLMAPTEYDRLRRGALARSREIRSISDAAHDFIEVYEEAMAAAGRQGSGVR